MNDYISNYCIEVVLLTVYLTYRTVAQFLLLYLKNPKPKQNFVPSQNLPCLLKISFTTFFKKSWGMSFKTPVRL